MSVQVPNVRKERDISKMNYIDKELREINYNDKRSNGKKIKIIFVGNTKICYHK